MRRRLGSVHSRAHQRHPPADTPRLGGLARLARATRTLRSTPEQGCGRCSTPTAGLDTRRRTGYGRPARASGSGKVGRGAGNSRGSERLPHAWEGQELARFGQGRDAARACWINTATAARNAWPARRPLLPTGVPQARVPGHSAPPAKSPGAAAPPAAAPSPSETRSPATGAPPARDGSSACGAIAPRSLCALQALFKSRPQAIPPRIAGLWRQLRQEQPGGFVPRFPAGQRRAGHLGTGKGEACAAPTCPGRGPKLVKGRPQVTPAGRKLPPVLIRTKEADSPGATRAERLGERWGTRPARGAGISGITALSGPITMAGEVSPKGYWCSPT